MISKLAFAATIPIAVFMSACSSHETGSGDHGNHVADGGGDAQSASDAPTLQSLAKMAGGLHVEWANPKVACDTVEGERKTATEAYAIAFTVPGEADNKHDATATQNTTYTYRLRCKTGSTYSPYSNEMSANPQQ